MKIQKKRKKCVQQPQSLQPRWMELHCSVGLLHGPTTKEAIRTIDPDVVGSTGSNISVTFLSVHLNSNSIDYRIKYQVT